MIANDLRHGCRALAKRPLSTLVGVISLALGLGANGVIWSALNTLFLRPLPVTEPGRLVEVYTRDAEHSGLLPVSWPNFRDLRAHNKSFSDLAISQRLSVGLATDSEPRQVRALLVSGNYFDLLGVRPAAGRTFLPEEDQAPGTHPVAVLSHALWQDHFAGDPGTVGSSILLNGHAFSIIGIAPPKFTGTRLETLPDLWVPAMSYPLVLWPGSAFLRAIDLRRALFFDVVGRLAPGISRDQARADLAVIARRLEQEYPDDNRGRSLEARPLVESYVASEPGVYGRYRLAVGLLAAVAGVVLLVGCGNAAHLLLVRALERRREIALRQALGGGRFSSGGQLIAEGLLLALLGGATGLALAAAVHPFLLSTRAPLLEPIVERLDIGWGTAAFTFGLAILTGLLTGLVPLLRAARMDLVADLKIREGGSARPTWYAGRHLLVVGQVTLASVALIFAGLFVRSLRGALDTDPGFDAGGTGLMRFTIGARGYSPSEGLSFYARVLREVARLPEVSSASLGRAVPLAEGHLYRTVHPEERTEEEALLAGSAVTGGYFDTLGLELIEGRDFDSRDREGTSPVVIVNRSLADAFWPGRSPLGQYLRIDAEGDRRQVVGVVDDSAVLSVNEESRTYFYVPLTQKYTPTIALFVRGKTSPESYLAAVRKAVQALDPALPISEAGTLSDVMARSLWASRLGATMVGIFGLFTLILSAMGIYSALSYSARQRSREAGVRMALGAAPHHVVRDLFARSMIQVGCGLAAGILAALLCTRLVANLLYGISALDLAAFATGLAPLVVVAAAAGLIPAWRALRVDPVAALRQE